MAGHGNNAAGSRVSIVYSWNYDGIFFYLSSSNLRLLFLINENILSKCFRSRPSCAGPRISPLAAQYECPRPSLSFMAGVPETHKIEPESYSIIPSCVNASGPEDRTPSLGHPGGAVRQGSGTGGGSPRGGPLARSRDPTTSFLTAATLVYAIVAGITAAAGTRLALQWRLLPSLDVVAVSQAPSPESNPDSPLPVVNMDAIISGFIHSSTETATWTMDHTAEDTSQDQSCLSAPPGLRDLHPEPLLPSLRAFGGKVPEILRSLHAGANDIRLRQTEVLKKDYRSLIETVRSTAPKAAIVVSGPLPTYRQGQERLYHADGLHPSRIGAAVLSDNISKTLCTR
ncbi:hypothetical protein F2P79_024509 [Pimephales promelas]|nr:hypothetical protein F2P79_024509 [Pimephales promelas]